MVKDFKISDWNEEVMSKEGTMDKAIFIELDEKQREEPIIQVYKDQLKGRFQLVHPNDVIIGIDSNGVILITRAPFDGKVIIR